MALLLHTVQKNDIGIAFAVEFGGTTLVKCIYCDAIREKTKIEAGWQLVVVLVHALAAPSRIPDRSRFARLTFIFNACVSFL